MMGGIRAAVQSTRARCHVRGPWQMPTQRRSQHQLSEPAAILGGPGRIRMGKRWAQASAALSSGPVRESR